jgi:hypothetical protein
VRGTQEMPAVTDLLVRAEGQRLLVDLQRRELHPQHLQQLDVDDELLIAADQAALQPAGRVHDEVGTGQEGGQQRHQRLVGGLRVGGLRRVQPAAGAERQTVVPGQLTGAQQAEGGLRRAEGRRAGLHIDVGQERAEDDRATRPDQLGQRDAGQRLGQLLDQRGRDRHRGHGPHQQERGQYHRLGGPVVLELRVQHPVVPAQRGVAVDQRDRGRHTLDRLAPAEQDRRHRDRVGRVRPGDHVAHVDLVGQRLQRVDHVQVPGVERGVVRLADHATRRIEFVECL